MGNSVDTIHNLANHERADLLILGYCRQCYFDNNLLSNILSLMGNDISNAPNIAKDIVKLINQYIGLKIASTTEIETYHKNMKMVKDNTTIKWNEIHDGFMRLLMLGLPGSGKTTLMNFLKKTADANYEPITPHLGCNIQSVYWKKAIGKISWDGQYCNTWTVIHSWDVPQYEHKQYYKNTFGIIWVIDSTDKKKYL
eukprot:420489_1